MKTPDLPPHYRAALAFGVPALLILLAIPILFREGRSRAVESYDARSGVMRTLATLREEEKARAAQPSAAPAVVAPAPVPEASPLPRPPEELSAMSRSASAPAPAPVPAAPPSAGAGPASAHMPAMSASAAGGGLPSMSASAGLGGGSVPTGAGPAMGGSAGAPSYNGGQMGQVQGYGWNKPKLKASDSQYGARAVRAGGPNAELSSAVGAAIGGGGSSLGGRGGPSLASSGGGFGGGSSAFGGGAAGGGSSGFPPGDSEGPEEFGVDDLPDLPAAEPLPDNPTTAQIEAANKKCQQAAQTYSGPMQDTGGYLSSLRGCDSKRCKRRARSACNRLNTIDCRAKRACPTTATQACGNTCDV